MDRGWILDAGYWIDPKFHDTFKTNELHQVTIIQHPVLIPLVLRRGLRCQANVQ